MVPSCQPRSISRGEPASPSSLTCGCTLGAKKKQTISLNLSSQDCDVVAFFLNHQQVVFKSLISSIINLRIPWIFLLHIHQFHVSREPGAGEGRRDTQLHPFHICIQVTTMWYVCQFLLMCTCLVFCSALVKFAQCCLLRLELWRARIPTKVQQLQFLYFDITRLVLHWLVNICSCILVFCHGCSISFRQTLMLWTR